jgi:hypothetical protein
MPWTQEKFFAFSKEMHEKAHQITLIKNKDYSPNENPFSNFEKLKDRFGDNWPRKLLASRIQEKADRLVNDAVIDRSKENSEAEDNDYLDCANYCIMALAYKKSQQDDINV